MSPLCQAILYLRGHLMVDEPTDNAVALQLPELLYQHLLGNRGYCALKIGEAKHLPAEQMEEDH